MKPYTENGGNLTWDHGMLSEITEHQRQESMASNICADAILQEQLTAINQHIANKQADLVKPLYAIEYMLKFTTDLAQVSIPLPPPNLNQTIGTYDDKRRE